MKWLEIMGLIFVIGMMVGAVTGGAIYLIKKSALDREQRFVKAYNKGVTDHQQYITQYIYDTVQNCTGILGIRTPKNETAEIINVKCVTGG